MIPKKKDNTILYVAGITVYVLIIMVILHYVAIMEDPASVEQGLDTLTMLEMAMTELTDNPLHMANPFKSLTALKYIGYASVALVIGVLYYITDKQMKDHVRDDIAKGSAKWDTDYKGFAKRHTDYATEEEFKRMQEMIPKNTKKRKKKGLIQTTLDLFVKPDKKLTEEEKAEKEEKKNKKKQKKNGKKPFISISVSKKNKKKDTEDDDE